MRQVLKITATGTLFLSRLQAGQIAAHKADIHRLRW